MARPKAGRMYEVGPLSPTIGNHPSHTPNTNIMRSASRKLGTETPMVEKKFIMAIIHLKNDRI
jgi:hypothetical protein